MNTIENKKKVKLKVEDLTIIFGKNKEKALELLDEGFSKKEILEKPAARSGSTKRILKFMKGNSS
uniref:ABC transporter ATP-binding protein n=1 Tax=Chryseobacterium endophyticum TaxID=1854762 RepID=A0AAU6WSN7_9FLAO